MSCAALSFGLALAAGVPAQPVSPPVAALRAADPVVVEDARRRLCLQLPFLGFPFRVHHLKNGILQFIHGAFYVTGQSLRIAYHLTGACDGVVQQAFQPDQRSAASFHGPAVFTQNGVGAFQRRHESDLELFCRRG